MENILCCVQMKCSSFEYFVLDFHTEDLWTTALTTLLKEKLGLLRGWTCLTW